MRAETSLDSNIALFVVASLAVIVAPGPDNIYVLTRGVAQGREVALASAWGMCSGLLFHTTLAALGLSAILASSAMAFTLVKYAGAAYLIYLGITALRSKEGFGASAPQFANPGTSGASLRLVVLGLVFALLSVVVFSGIALFSGVLGDRLSRNPRYATALRWLTGCVLVGLGLRLAFSGRH